MAIDRSLVSGSMGMMILRLLTEKDKQFVTSYEQEVLGKVRKYYQITGEGKKHLEQKKSEWKEYSKAVSNVLALEV